MMPVANATAGGRSGARAMGIAALFADRDEIPERRELLWPDADDVSQRFQRVESAATLSLVDDSLREHGADPWQSRELGHPGAIDVDGFVVQDRWARRQR